MAFYGNPVRAGTDAVASLGDGQTINIKWFQAYPDRSTEKILYHIYFSTVKEDVFTEGPKYVSYDGSLEANIIDLVPGQDYFFAVRSVSYNPNIFDPAVELATAYDNLKFYPTSLL